MSSDDDQKLWDYAIEQEKYIVQQFGFAVIGIGALFYVYTLVSSVHFRTLVAMTGLGICIIIWMHSFAASKDREAIFDDLKNTAIRKRHMKAAQWRNKSPVKYFYFGVLRPITYFSSLLALAWFLLTVSNLAIIWFNYQIPFLIFEKIGIVAMLMTFLLLIYQTRKQRQKYEA